jgi:hypothetical protein
VQRMRARRMKCPSKGNAGPLLPASLHHSSRVRSQAIKGDYRRIHEEQRAAVVRERNEQMTIHLAS